MAQAFFNGSLVIDWSESIGHECKISISGWDSGLIVTGHDQDELSPLSLIDVGDWIFTVDSDVLPLGATNVIYEMNRDHSSLKLWAYSLHAVGFFLCHSSEVKRSPLCAFTLAS